MRPINSRKHTVPLFQTFGSWAVPTHSTAAGDNVFENALRMHLMYAPATTRSLTDDETNSSSPQFITYVTLRGSVVTSVCKQIGGYMPTYVVFF